MNPFPSDSGLEFPAMKEVNSGLSNVSQKTVQIIVQLSPLVCIQSHEHTNTFWVWTTFVPSPVFEYLCNYSIYLRFTSLEWKIVFVFWNWGSWKWGAVIWNWFLFDFSQNDHVRDALDNERWVCVSLVVCQPLWLVVLSVRDWCYHSRGPAQSASCLLSPCQLPGRLWRLGLDLRPSANWSLSPKARSRTSLAQSTFHHTWEERYVSGNVVVLEETHLMWCLEACPCLNMFTDKQYV